jgi:hypothetical protein
MMKNSFLFLLFIAFMTFSCEMIDPNGGGVITIDGLNGNSVTVRTTPCDDGLDLDLGDLPQVVRDYINQEFPNASIDRIELFREDDDDTEVFGVRLSDDTEILFSAEGVVIRSSNDNSEQEIRLEDLVAGITQYIADNYPDLVIDHAETELEYGHTYIEVYLSDGTELYFDLEGNFLCDDDRGDDDRDWSDDRDDDNGRDDDDDDDDDDGDDDDDDDDRDDGRDDDDGDDDDDVNLNDLPAGIAEFVTANYSEYYIDEVEWEDLCDDQQRYYKVELERENDRNEPDLYFDADGNFLFASVDIQIGDLPAEVTGAIETNYAGYSIDLDDIERYEYPDGTFKYEVELRGSWNDDDDDDDDKEFVFNPDGTVFCNS